MYKRILSVLLAALMLFSAIACGKTDPVETTPIDTSPVTESAAETDTVSETEAETEAKTEPATEAATEPETEPVTEAATKAPETKPAESEAETEEILYKLNAKVPLDKSPDLGFDPDPAKAPKPDLDNLIRVTAAPYNAKGNGKSDDREAIQSAIDDAYKAGGGTVCLDAGKTFSSGNIILRSNVVLYFEDGAVLQQTHNPNAYVKPTADGGYEPIKPLKGHDYKAVMYGHSWAYNYPFVYAGEGTENITITGKGTIRMHRGKDCDSTIHICPIGMYKVNNFEVSEITISNYSSYALQPNICTNGLIKHITIKDPADLNGDGISLINCQNIRVTQNYLTTSDDGIYVATNYNDPRKGTWCSAKEPIPSMNIQIDHNYSYAKNGCKGYCFILWGVSAPDLRTVEARNIYIHNNYFNSMGIWDDDPYDTISGSTPVTGVRFYNNKIDGIQSNFYGVPLADVNEYTCISTFLNGNFERTAITSWSMRLNGNIGSAGAADDAVGQDGTWYGFIDHLDEGDAAIYQGLTLSASFTYTFTAKVQSSGDTCRLFVKNLDTQELIASREFLNTAWETVSLEFTVPENGNYHVGIERGNAKKGWARIDNATLEAGMNRISENTIFSSQVPTSSDDGGGYRNELGTLFSPKVDGQVTKVLIYTDAKESGIHYVSIWDARSQKLLTEKVYEWDITPGTEGWQEFELPTPVSLKAGSRYVVSVSPGPDGLFMRGNNQLQDVVESTYLKTYKMSGRYSNSKLKVMPTQSANTNYFRDVYFVPAQ